MAINGIHSLEAQKQAQEEAKQIRYQQTDEEFQDSVFGEGFKNWTGIDYRNFKSSENTDVGSWYEGVGEVAVAPLVTTFKVAGGILGFGAKLVAPVFGFLGSALGGLTGQGGAQGGGQAAPNGGYAPSTGGGSTAPATTPTSTPSTGSTSASSSTKSSSTDTAKKASAARTTNETAGSVDTFRNVKTGATQSIPLNGIDTQGYEQVSQIVRVDVEQLKGTNADVEKYQKLYDEADKEVQELKAKNKDKTANAKTKAKAEVEQYDRVIDDYTAKIDNIERNIAGQEALLAQCKDDDPKKAEYKAAIDRLIAEKEALVAQIQDAVNKKAAAEKTLESLKDTADVAADSIEAKLAQAEAKRDAYKAQLEHAKSVQKEYEGALKKDVEETDKGKDGKYGTEYTAENLDAAKARQKKDNKTADVKEGYQQFTRKDVDNTVKPEEGKVQAILAAKAAATKPQTPPAADADSEPANPPAAGAGQNPPVAGASTQQSTGANQTPGAGYEKLTEVKENGKKIGDVVLPESTQIEYTRAQDGKPTSRKITLQEESSMFSGGSSGIIFPAGTIATDTYDNNGKITKRTIIVGNGDVTIGGYKYHKGQNIELTVGNNNNFVWNAPSYLEQVGTARAAEHGYGPRYVIDVPNMTSEKM